MFYLCIRLITKHMDEITKIETVDQYDQLFGLETLHPLVNVIDFSKATKSVEYIRMNIGFYCLFLKDAKCGDLTYGRKNYDYQEGTVVCMAPGQVSGIDNRNRPAPRTKSIGVLFHPDLIRGTSLGQHIKNYTFFSYESNEALHMSDRERRIILNCFHEIREELEHNIDKHTKQIITSNIETLLNHCVRFYERQFVTRELAYQFRTNTSTVFRFGKDVYHRIAIRTVLCRTDASFSELFRRSGEKGNRKIGTRIYSVGHHGKSKRIVGRKQ